MDCWLRVVFVWLDAGLRDFGCQIAAYLRHPWRDEDLEVGHGQNLGFFSFMAACRFDMSWLSRLRFKAQTKLLDLFIS